MNPFPADRLTQERPDPVEASSLAWINVPLVLLALFLGFGVTYLGLRTPNTALGKGDSRSPVNATFTTSEPLQQLGEKIFTKNCQACHQANGAGVGTAFPPLDGSEWVTGDPETMVAIVLHGVSGELTVKGTVFNGQMPPFKNTLSVREIAAVASYVRGAWSNREGAISEELVIKVKENTAHQEGPWQGGAELPRP